MSVTVTDPIAGPFTPNGVTVAFPFDFKVNSTDGNVEILVVQALDGVTSIVDPADYSAALAVDGEGGTVTFDAAPVGGTGDIYLVSDPGYAQLTGFGSEGPFTPSTLNGIIDRVSVRIVALRAELDRALIAPIGETIGTLPALDDRAGNYLAFDEDGDPVAGIGSAAMTALQAEAAASTSGLVDEIAARISGDSTEATLRTAADASLSARIDTEESGRNAADTALMSLLSTGGAIIGNASLNAASRALLKGLDTSLGLPAILTEAGREGMFKWDGTVPIVTHQADTAEAVYVAPNAAAIGAWVRFTKGVSHATDFGVIGDDATDNAANMQAAATALISQRQLPAAYGITVGYGTRSVRFPAESVRYGTTLEILGDLRLAGDGGDSSTVLYYTGTDRPAYINSLDPVWPNGPFNVNSFESDGIVWNAPNATEPLFIGNSTQRRVQFLRGQMRGTANSEYAMYCGDAVYALHLGQFEFIGCDKGIYVGEYCDLFTMDGRSINFYNRREVLTLACPTAVISNVDFELGNLDNTDHATAPPFIRIIQNTIVQSKARNISLQSVRFGSETYAPGNRTVAYDIIFSNDGVVDTPEVTFGVTVNDCKHFSQSSGNGQKIAPINILCRIKNNTFLNNFYASYSSGYYITSTDPALVAATGSIANNRVSKLSDVDPVIRGWFISDEAEFVQALTGNATLPNANMVAYGYAGHTGITVPTGSPLVSVLVASSTSTNYSKCLGLTYHGDAVASRPIHIAINGALLTTALDTTASSFDAPVYAHTDGTLTLTAPAGTVPLQVARVQTIGANAKVIVDIQNEELTYTPSNLGFTTTRARLYTVLYNAAISGGTKTVTLNATNPRLGDRVKVVRTAAATGGDNVSIGGLKNLSAGQWGEATYNGSAWVLSAHGSL